MPAGYDDSAVPVAAELHRLVRRLRGLSPRAWRTGDRAAAVRRLLVELAALTAPGRSVPDLPEHALADAVAVLGQDALEGGDPARLERVAALVADALLATR